MCVWAQSFCNLAKPVGTSYTETITTPGTYYYSAQTENLPMDMYFISADSTCATPPELWFDMTCTPGYYSDPNIRELIQDTATYHVSVPMKLNCETSWVDSLHAYVHHLKLGKSYRNKLKLFGIDYDVTAYVKAIISCSGVAQIEQDTSSNACEKEARQVTIMDDTRVLAHDSLSTYILPFEEWLTQADSIALHWEGPEPATVWIESSNCEFYPDEMNAWDFYDIPAYGDYHLSGKKMQEALDGSMNSTGFFFAKIFSAEEGYFSTRPLLPETKGATMLHFDSIQHVSVAEDSVFFCFPKKWTGIEWVADTRRMVKLYVHTSPELAPVDSFLFDLQDTAIRRVLRWTKPEMNILRPYANGDLLFVRFECSGDFTFTPYELTESSECLLSAIRIQSGRPYECAKDKLFSLKYDEWKNYPMEIRWETPVSTNLQNVYLVDTCHLQFGLTWSSTNTSVKNHTVYRKQTKRGGETWTVDSATVTGWESRVTPEGFFYIQISGGGTLTFTNDRPAEQDPDDGLPLDPPQEDPGPATGVNYTQPETEYTKILRNGQIFIIRAGKTYTITGQVVKTE